MTTIIEQLMGGGERKLLSPRRQITVEEIQILRSNLEQLTTGMEITVTYKPVLRIQHNSTSLTDITTKCLLSVLKRHDFKLMLIGEYSDSGMYHMHGLLLTNTGRTVDALKRKLTRELGRVQIKTITWTEAYINYILKDTDKNRKIYNDEIIKINTEPMKGT